MTDVEIAAIAEGLTEAQAWAFDLIARGQGNYPAQLGQGMIDRPGARVCEYKRKPGWHKAQGLAFIGGPMISRLDAKGLVWVDFGNNDRRTKLTPLGLRVREYLEKNNG